jgi:outer membrane protein OmpA-like peptidoglycan-associated protein
MMCPVVTPRSHVLAILVAWTSLAFGGCATPQATSVSQELPFEQAVTQATDGLVSQTQKLPAFLTKVESKLVKRAVVLDPMIDATSGQQTGVTKRLEQRVSEQLIASSAHFEVLPFQASNIAKAQLLLTGTTTNVASAVSKRALRIDLALIDLKNGTSIAQASAVARADDLDNNPTPYYRDSPVLVKDKVVDGYIRTSATAPGQRADSEYLERIATATLINEATNSYNAERYEDALAQYKSAMATPAGEQLRVLNGIYLANWKLGRSADAERAFAKVVALGIANTTLGVKFLFNPGGTEFWSDPKISGPYAMWLRQIAHEAATAKVCIDIVGHTSRTGTEPTNDRLSLQRAAYIKQRLEADAPELARKTKAIGKGFRENIVGTGTDDVRDALDRRVEFKIAACA